MTSDVIVRDARADELDAVSSLLSAAYEEYLPATTADLSEEERRAWDAYRADIADVASRASYSNQIVAESHRRIVGSVTYFGPGHEAHYPPESDASHWPSGWASFRLLGVLPEARGRGVGRILTDECIRRARGEGAAVLALHTTFLMAVARDMYVKMGWKRAPQYDFFPMPDFTVEAYTLDL